MAARKRGEALEHLLFVGPVGVGKTTLAGIVANEMGVGMKVMTGSAIQKVGDFAAILTNLRAGDILIIEQPELLRKPIIEVLYPAMNEFALEVVIGKGSSARQVRLKLPRFTVIAATSKLSQVDDRLKNCMSEFDFSVYSEEELSKLILLFAKQQGIVIDIDGASLIAEYSNGIPSQALTILKRVDKYATVLANGQITLNVIRKALELVDRKDEPLLKERQPIPDEVKMFVWQRDKGRCVICGSQENLEFDHIIPVSKGGSNTARNIQLLCEKHNRSKGGNLV